ncbi:hypothetical protein HBH92_195950 [Parastagonospora nodorum]|nr:hypothetical protein HBH92_195950 [Parastagonospora nodorum]KAH4420597.1 hypothetical protein HBH93_204160 [Parastagonospora nodorum]KAH4434057.1 hypothetical protein HBH91_213450 [Parastagonospora nodorum]KAH4485838.1 hypothetical protein HBH89_214600 [Parastagonospora nodorum]KAH4529857.1 hypothetical protein HBH85_195230 [Parastagonospora nodorum]
MSTSPTNATSFYTWKAEPVVVLTVYCQYVEARDLGSYMQSMLKQKEPPNMLKKMTRANTIFFSLVQMRSADNSNEDDEETSLGAQPWTITHSLYATMGGFVLASSDRASLLVSNGSQYSSLDSIDSFGSGSASDNSPHQDKRIHEFFVERYRSADQPATGEEVALLKLASSFARKHGITGDLKKCLHEVCSKDLHEKLLTTRIQNLPKDHFIYGPLPTRTYGTPTPHLGFWERLNRGILMNGLIITSCFYGGFHLLAWNHEFRTSTEELLWKISALTIATFGIAYLVGIYLFGRVDEGFFERHDYVYCCCAVSPNILVTLFYIFCRVYIIIECLLDVFHLPESAFRVPQWSQYFPHLS